MEAKAPRLEDGWVQGGDKRGTHPGLVFVSSARSLLPGALSEVTNEQFSLDLSELEDI